MSTVTKATDPALATDPAVAFPAVADVAVTPTARMESPVFVLPDALPPLMELGKVIRKSGLPRTTALLVELRASQINGCGYCVDMHAAELRQRRETDQRLFAVAAWREAPFFTPAERAALELTEAATRLADRGEAVPDAVWDEARAHFDDRQLAALILEIAQINFWNRLNVITRQVAGTGWAAQQRSTAAGDSVGSGDSDGARATTTV